MDGQVDFTIAERSRLLAGNRPPVSLSSLGTGFQEGHGLTRPPQGLPDLPPGATSSSLTSLGPFPSRYLPSISMHSTASSLAVMGSYLGSSHSDSLKSLVPDSLSQYWAAAHAEGYPRYVINNNLYPPYAAPYLPGSDSLSLLPPGHSASQQHAAYHRLYDLNKDAPVFPDVFLGGMPHSLGQPGSLYGMAPSTPGLQPRPSSASALPSPLVLKQEAKCEPLVPEKSPRERRGQGKGDSAARDRGARDLGKKVEDAVAVSGRTERVEVGTKPASDKPPRSSWNSGSASGKVDGEGGAGTPGGGARGASGHHQDKVCKRSAVKPHTQERQATPDSPAVQQEGPGEGDKERRSSRAKGEDRSRPPSPPGVLRTQAIPTLSTVTVSVSAAPAAPHPSSACSGSTQSVFSCVQPVSSTSTSGSPLSVSASALGGQSSSALPYYHTLYSQPPGSAAPGVRKVQATTTFVPEVGTLGPSPQDKAPLARLQEPRVKSETTPRSSCCREKAAGGGSNSIVGSAGGLLKVPSVMCSASATGDSETERTTTGGEVGVKTSFPSSKRKAGEAAEVASGGGKTCDAPTPIPVSSVAPTRPLLSSPQRPATVSGSGPRPVLTSPSLPDPVTSLHSRVLSPGSRLCVRSCTDDVDGDLSSSAQPLALTVPSSRKRDSGRSPAKSTRSTAPVTSASRTQSKKSAPAADLKSRCDVIDVTSGEDDTIPEVADDPAAKSGSSSSQTSVPVKQLASDDGAKDTAAKCTDVEGGVMGKLGTEEGRMETLAKPGSRLCRRTALIAESAREKRCGSAPPSAPTCPTALSEGSLAQSDRPDPHSDRPEPHPERPEESQEHTGCNIPVGIAVARQRAEQPRGQECGAGRGAELTRGSDAADAQRQFSQDFKEREDFLRQQKALLSGSGKTGVTSSLPPNLVVTGSVTGTDTGLGTEDPRVRSLQAPGQWLPGAPMQPPSWLANPFLHPSIATSTAPSLQDPSPFPFPPPPGGFKLAQDPLTGQIFILPAAASDFVEQSGGLWSAFQAASHSQPGPPFSQLLTPHTVSPQDQDTPRTDAYTDGQASMADGTETEASVGEEASGGEHASQPTSPSHPASSPPSSSRDRSSPQPSQPASPNSLQPELRDKLPLSTQLLSSDVGLQGAGAPFYPYTAQFPYVFNPGLLPMAGLPVSLAEPLTVKTEPPSVQSRGTSPMVLTPPPSDETSRGGMFNEPPRPPVTKCSASVQTCDLDLKPPPPVALREQCCQTCHSPESQLKSEGQEEAKPHVETDSAKKDTSRRRVGEGGDGGYNPYTDPQILQAADGLELLSALAERRAMLSDAELPSSPAPKPPATPSRPPTPSVPSALASPSDSLKSEPLVPTPAPTPTADRALLTSSSGTQVESSDKTEAQATPKKDATRGSQDSGSSPKWSFPRKSEGGSLAVGSVKVPADLHSFLQIGFDTMDAMEVEMRLRLAELQRRYKEKQRELAKLQPKVKDKEAEDKSAAAKRRPGRPRKRKFFSKKSDDDSPGQGGTGKGKEPHHKKRRQAEELVDRVFRKRVFTACDPANEPELQLPPTKSDKRKDPLLASAKHGTSLKRRGSSSSSRSTENSNHSDGPFGSAQAVFGSKKPQQHSTVTISKAKFKTTKRPADFKSSSDHDVGNLFSNIASSMLGGEEKKKRSKKGGKQEQSEAARPAPESKLGRSPHAVSPTVLESGLGLLAKFASTALQHHGMGPNRVLGAATTASSSSSSSSSTSSPASSSPVITGFGSFSSSGGSASLVPREPGVFCSAPPACASLPSSPTSAGQRSQRESDTDNSDNNGSSGNKKRKPGRPKKYTSSNKTQGVTETIVAKKAKLLRMSELASRPLQERRSSNKSEERKIKLDSQAPMTPLNLDEEWCLRRSERIFLSEPSLQPSTSSSSPRNGPPPSASVQPAAKSGAGKQTCQLQQSKDKFRPSSSKPQEEKDRDRAKVQKAKSLQELTQKVKRKYNKTLSKKAGANNGDEKSSAKARQQAPPRWVSSSSLANSDSDGDDVPLSALKQRPTTPEPRSCTITKEELRDNLRVLHFQNGLFYEGVIKAIQPPDVYGVLIDNERGNRPHIYSQEEILKNAIFDVRPGSQRFLAEGTRVCAYWSQQFSCLYPGTIVKSSPNPHVTITSVNVEFDDGDTGRINIDYIRLLPPDFPIVQSLEPNALLHLTTRRRRTTSEDGDGRKSNEWFFETPSVSDDFGRFRRCSVGKAGSRAGSGGRRESVGSLADVESEGAQDGKKAATKTRKSSSADRVTPRPRGRPPGSKSATSSAAAKRPVKSEERAKTASSDSQPPIIRPAAFDPSKIQAKKEEDDDDDDDSSDEEEETSEEDETSDSSEEEEDEDEEEEEMKAAQERKKRGRKPKAAAQPGAKKARTDRSLSTDSKGKGKGKSKVAAVIHPHQLWRWSGSSTKRPGMKGKARKEFYRSIVRGRETISVGDSAVFLSVGRINCPYVGRIESMWESWNGQMSVKVRWFYHPEETHNVKKLAEPKGALFESQHEDENDVQTISHRCELLTATEFRRRRVEAEKRGLDFLAGGSVYYLAGQYDPYHHLVKTYEPDVL